ncbi:hypothetical protein EV663_104106 [Rhodovulum bhavnagarense]|uniref:GAF domain-containing protein n=1 Tax=Rhodovulum bhavnagarense TaxID=992286 RepID=A0A4R2RG21_9RHOB|nr:hypothetical protein [Rhodovulum bhavnagarense]TCP61654.1 hypothetical protein EV663_104106 [Rhodovulum bhavnagarense]
MTNKKGAFEVVDAASARSKALVADLLVMTETGDFYLNKACEALARLRGATHAFVILVHSDQFFLVGRYGYVQNAYTLPQNIQPDWKGEEQIELLNPATDFDGFDDLPEEFKVHHYVHLAPMRVEGTPVGFVGLANIDPMPPATPDQRIALDLVRDMVVERLRQHHLLKRHTRELFGILQGDS